MYDNVKHIYRAGKSIRSRVAWSCVKPGCLKRFWSCVCVKRWFILHIGPIPFAW